MKNYLKDFLFFLFLSFCWTSAFSEQSVESYPVVTSHVVESKLWSKPLRYAGSIHAYSRVSIRSEMPGILRNINVASGQDVEEGSILFEQDTDVEQADFQIAVANKNLSEIQLQRLGALLKSKGVTQDSYDIQLFLHETQKSSLNKIATILEKKKIKAPFDGRIGIVDVNVGQFLEQGDELAVLYSLDKVKIETKVPQSKMSHIKVGNTVTAMVDGFLHNGVVEAISPELDYVTRSFRVVTVFSNESSRLLPGMFVELLFPADQTSEALVVPVSAVKYSLKGIEVATLIDQGTHHLIKMELVELGGTRGDFVEITKGLSEGSVIVSTGVFKVSEGQKVVIDNSMSPEFNLVLRHE